MPYAHPDAQHVALYVFLTIVVLCAVGVVIFGLLRWPIEERQDEEVDDTDQAGA